MKQVLIRGGGVAVEDVPAPAAGQRNVLVRVEWSCVSVGTESASVEMSALPLYRRALRVSMGGALQTPFVSVLEWPAGLAKLRAVGFRIAALTPDRAAVDISSFGPVPGRLVLLLGAEGQGLSAAARAAADVHLRIPIVPGVDSLNVATAAGIALHRLARPEP